MLDFRSALDAHRVGRLHTVGIAEHQPGASIPRHGEPRAAGLRRNREERGLFLTHLPSAKLEEPKPSSPALGAVESHG
jgi:hypothetical protein